MTRSRRRRSPLLPLCGCILLPLLAPLSLAALDEVQMAELVAAFSDPRRNKHQPAAEALVAVGGQALPALEVLARDPDPALRVRVALVAGAIGGERAFALLRNLVQDKDADVREVAILALAQTGRPEAYDIVRPFIRDPLPDLRESAALALGSLGDPRAIRELASWPVAGGDRHLLEVPRGSAGERAIKRIQAAMQAGLRSLVLDPDHVPQTIAMLEELRGTSLEALLEATWELGDPRLAPALAVVLDEAHREARIAAAVSLTANGDSRAIPALVQAATGGGDLGRQAAATLRRLTGYEAAAGSAWQLWWQEHAAQVEVLHERDAFIARLHDARFLPEPAELARFSASELLPLVQGVRGDGGAHWPPLAWRALRRDQAARWTTPLLDRYDRSEDEAERVALVVILDQLGDPAASQGLRLRYQDLLALAHGHPDRQGSLRAALELALDIQPPPLNSGDLRR